MRDYNLGFISNEDVVNDNPGVDMKNTVYEELTNEHADILTSLYLLAFATYEGFDNLKNK